MILSVEVNLVNSNLVGDKLEELTTSLSNFKNELSEISGLLKKFYNSDVFASDGQALGQRWAPLSQPYATYKGNKYGFGKGILVASGKMQGSFVTMSNSTMMTVTNTAPYFKYHQSSAPRSSNLPRRAMIGFNFATNKIIGDVFQAGIEARLASI
jgi:phage gpG-like protein